MEFQYNRVGELIWRKDQNGSIHSYEFDNLGRLLHDRVTTLGSGVDGSVRRISTTYHIDGQVSAITSTNNATIGSGAVVNEVKYEYDTNGLLAKEYQNPSGAVTSSSLYVGYSYDATKSGELFTRRLRPTSMRYPSGTMMSNMTVALHDLYLPSKYRDSHLAGHQRVATDRRFERRGSEKSTFQLTNFRSRRMKPINLQCFVM